MIKIISLEYFQKSARKKVQEKRVQTLLKELVENEKLIDNGVTKGKRYKKANK